MPLTTEYRTCDGNDGDLFSANNGRYTQLRGHIAIIHHQGWIAMGGTRVDQVAITLPQFPYLLNEPANPSCEGAVLRYFRDVADNLLIFNPEAGLQAGKWYIVAPPMPPAIRPVVRGPFESAQDAYSENDRTMGKYIAGAYVWRCPEP